MPLSITPNPLDQERASVASDNKKDLYSSGAGEIFTKNFLAGLAHALGAILVYLVFLAALSFLIYRFLLPQLQTIIGNYTKTLTPLLNQSGSSEKQVNPQQIQQLLNQLSR